MQDALGDDMAKVVDALDPFDAMMLGSLGPVVGAADALNEKRFEYIVRTELDYGPVEAQLFLEYMFSRMYTEDIRKVLRLLAEHRYFSRFIMTPGPDLQLITSVRDVGSMPSSGKNLVVVADVAGVLHFRIFDEEGKVVADTDEKGLTGKARQVEDLRKQIERLGPAHEPTEGDKVLIVDAVTSILGQGQYTQELREYLKGRGIKLEEFKDRETRAGDFGRGAAEFFEEAMKTIPIVSDSIYAREQEEARRLPAGYAEALLNLRMGLFSQRLTPGNAALGAFDYATLGIPLGYYGAAKGVIEGGRDILLKDDPTKGTKELLPAVILLLTHLGGAKGRAGGAGDEGAIRGPAGAGQFELPGYRGPLDPGLARLARSWNWAPGSSRRAASSLNGSAPTGWRRRLASSGTIRRRRGS